MSAKRQAILTLVVPPVAGLVFYQGLSHLLFFAFPYTSGFLLATISLVVALTAIGIAYLVAVKKMPEAKTERIIGGIDELEGKDTK